MQGWRGIHLSALRVPGCCEPGTARGPAESCLDAFARPPAQFDTPAPRHLRRLLVRHIMSTYGRIVPIRYKIEHPARRRHLPPEPRIFSGQNVSVAAL